MYFLPNPLYPNLPAGTTLRPGGVRLISISKMNSFQVKESLYFYFSNLVNDQHYVSVTRLLNPNVFSRKENVLIANGNSCQPFVLWNCPCSTSVFWLLMCALNRAYESETRFRRHYNTRSFVSKRQNPFRVSVALSRLDGGVPVRVSRRSTQKAITVILPERFSQSFEMVFSYWRFAVFFFKNSIFVKKNKNAQNIEMIRDPSIVVRRSEKFENAGLIGPKAILNTQCCRKLCSSKAFHRISEKTKIVFREQKLWRVFGDDVKNIEDFVLEKKTMSLYSPPIFNPVERILLCARFTIIF